MNPRHLAPLVVAVAAIALSGCGGGGATDTTDATTAGTADTAEAAGNGATEATVTIETFNFQPDPLVVHADTSITFVNEDAIDHTVTAGTRENPTPDSFDGELPQKGATFELTLDEPGTYDYFCRIHPGPGMTASIVVQ